MGLGLGVEFLFQHIPEWALWQRTRRKQSVTRDIIIRSTTSALSIAFLPLPKLSSLLATMPLSYER